MNRLSSEPLNSLYLSYANFILLAFHSLLVASYDCIIWIKWKLYAEVVLITFCQLCESCYSISIIHTDFFFFFIRTTGFSARMLKKCIPRLLALLPLLPVRISIQSSDGPQAVRYCVSCKVNHETLQQGETI